eukprot:scaffold142015_cov93-Phaeocystis_antarctica.AAC.2
MQATKTKEPRLYKPTCSVSGPAESPKNRAWLVTPSPMKASMPARSLKSAGKLSRLIGTTKKRLAKR